MPTVIRVERHLLRPSDRRRFHSRQESHPDQMKGLSMQNDGLEKGKEATSNNPRKNILAGCWSSFGLLLMASIILNTALAQITHGPILGRPTSTSVRVWIRTEKPTRFKVFFGETLSLKSKKGGVSGRTSAEDDSTGYVELTGLSPNTQYYYGVALGKELMVRDPEGEEGFASFRTLPAASDYYDASENPVGLFNFSFGVGFGNHYYEGREEKPVYRTILDQHGEDLCFFLMNGDYVYEGKRGEDNRPWQLEAFRADYKYYFESKPTMRRFFQYVPTIFIFDDHELSGEKGAGHVGWPLDDWDPTQRTPNQVPVYRDVALKAWYEYVGWSGYDRSHYQPIRRGTAQVKADSNVLYDRKADFTTLNPDFITTIHGQINSRNIGVYGFKKVLDTHRLQVKPAFRYDEEDLEYSIGTHHYFDWRVGNTHFFAIDARTERTLYDPRMDADPRQFILGETQLRWLMEGVRNSGADFIFIVSSVNWVVKHTNPRQKAKPAAKPGMKAADPWSVKGKEDGFPGALVEREKLLTLFDSLGKPIIILTGDLHAAHATRITDNVWEFMMGPLTSGTHSLQKAGNPPFTGNYKTGERKVRIKWIAADPTEESQITPGQYYGVITVNNVAEIKQDKEIYWKAYDKPQVIVQFYDGMTGKLVYAEGISVADVKRAKKETK